MKRREFSGLLGAMLLGAGGSASCRRTITVNDALAALVREVVVPNSAAVTRTSELCLAAARRFVSAPSPATLGDWRSAWRKALLAWKRMQVFRANAVVETGAFFRAVFSPVRPNAIEAAVTSESAIDETLLTKWGVDTQGLYALEYLLFPSERDDARVIEAFAGEGNRRSRFALLLAEAVNKAATRVEKTVEGTPFANTFVAGGQASLNELVGWMVATVEVVVVHRLGSTGPSEGHAIDRKAPEGSRSGMSQQIALAELEASEAFFRGGKSGGIVGLVRPRAPALADDLTRLYQTALRRVRDLGAPIERLVATNRPALDAAVVATRSLEIALKTELVSTLGITLTFSSFDSD